MSSPNSSLIEVHEDRIVRLEDNVGECRTGIALLSEKMDGLGDKMDAHAATHEHLDTRVAAIERHHEVEREVRERTHERRVKAFKIAAALVSAGGVISGIVMKLLGN